MLFIGLKSKRFLNKILSDEKKKDEIIEALHKYTRLEKEMNIFNTEENTKYYRDHGDIKSLTMIKYIFGMENIH